ncbi:ankyrin repeat-containing domain protein [Mycena floridula]|nr:ankyrin repeat-containing domain protein [Mycena floridula]
MDSAQILHGICAALCYILFLLNNINPTLLSDYAFAAVLIWRQNIPAFPAKLLHASELEVEQLTTTEVYSEPDLLGLLHKICLALEAFPNHLKGKRLQLYSELKAIKPIIQYQHPLSQGNNIVLSELHSQLVAIATKLKQYSINQSWPFSSEEQQIILSTLSRLKLALLSLSDTSTFSVDENKMNDEHPLLEHSRPGRTLHMGMIGSYIGSAGGSVLSNNIINEADPGVGQGVDKLNDREDDKERAKQHAEFLQWISPLDFHLTQTTTFGRHAVGTGTWLLQDSRFLDWLQGTMRLLWCPGNPGVGKTILASVIIDHLQRLVVTPEDVIIYIYCQYNRQIEQTPMQLLGSILKQLVERRPAVSKHLLSLYMTHSSCKTELTFAELMDALRTELQSYTRAYLIVDALDECSDEARDFFLSTGSPAGLRSLTDNLHILMTSRNMPSITHALKVQGGSTIHIEAHVEDLQTYIRERLVGVKRLNRLVKDDRSLEDKIIEVVISKAAGMFLQAKLHLDSLAKQTNVKTLLKALDRLPEVIWRSYDNAMLRIDAQGETDSKLAYHIFYWLSCSERPLTVLELQHAVAVSLDPEMTEMEPDAIVDIETLTDVCAGLIIIDESFTGSSWWAVDKAPTVGLVHYTMQEYLQLNQQKLFPDIRFVMAITCLTYMSFDVFSTKEWKVADSRRIYTRYPLYEYAVLFWGKHACDNQEQIFPHVQRFLQKPANVACASKAFREHRYLFLDDLHFRASSHTLYLPTVFSLVQVLRKLLPYHHLVPADGTLLHLASFLGHVETVMVLLTKLDPNTQDKSSRTALSYSAERGQFKMVQLFLNLELIQPDLPDKNGHTPFIHACHHRHVEINGWSALFHAVRHKHLDVAQLLLQHSDTQPDIPDNTGKTPLIWAAQQSSQTFSEVIELLVRQQAVNPNSQDKHLRTALSYSAECGDLKTVQLLLGLQDIQPDLPDKDGHTPFIHACHHGHIEMVQLFLARQDINHKSLDCAGRNGLSHAADQGHLGVARLLLQHNDIQPDIPDNAGHTPLILAAQKSTSLKLIKLLLHQEGVDPESHDEHLRTVLSYSAENGDLETVQLLLAMQFIQPDLPDRNGRTPFIHASHQGHVKIVQLFLDRHDVNHNIRDYNGWTALCHAVGQKHLDVTRLLLQHSDIQPDIPDNTGHTPLILAAQKSTTSSKLIKLLLHQEGVNPESQDEHLRTALSYSAEYGDLETVQLLLAMQFIQPDLPDRNGRTPFIHASHQGHVEIVQLFLDRHDVNHNIRDYNGWTALFHAVDQKHLDVTRLLLQHGDLQPDIPDNTGKTPLIWAAQKLPPSWPCLRLMKALLERKDVNPDAQDEHLRTALSYNAGGMCSGLFDDLISEEQALCLLEKGATADLQDKYLRTPLSYAIESHQSRIIALLLQSPAVDRYSPNLYLHTPIWSPDAERLLKEYNEFKKNHLLGKSDAKFPPDSSQLVIAGSLDKVREEGAWAWGFYSPHTLDQYTNNLDILFLDIATPQGGGFHGSIHNPLYGTQTRGVVSITALSTTTATCLLSNLPLVGGKYMISPNKQGVYYEVRILEMEHVVGVDDMKKFFESGQGKEYLPDTKLQNGDIVGVGFIHESGTVFFTLNGSRLPDAFTGIFLPHSKHELLESIKKHL